MATGLGKMRGGIRPCRTGKKTGFTLLEVVMAVAIFTGIMLGSLYALASQVRGNRMTSHQVNGTKLMTSKLEEIYTACRNDRANFQAAGGTAKAVVRFLRTLTPLGAAGESVTANVAAGTLTYTFVVPAVGAKSLDANSTAPEVLDAANALAVGTLTLFLRENAVPNEFRAWNDVTLSGSSTPVETPVVNNGFDMNGNGSTGDSFTHLFSGDDRSLELFTVPATIQVQYFRRLQDVTDGVPYYTVNRSFIIDDGSLGRTTSFSNGE